MTATDPIIVIELGSGYEYHVDTSHADKLTTESVDAYRNQRIQAYTAGTAADKVIWTLYRDRKGSECVCPVRRWYKKYGERGTWVYEFNEVEPGVWSVRPVGRIAKREAKPCTDHAGR